MIKIGLVFGGRSGEHEVSINSARSVLEGLQALEKYQILPFYLDRLGFWHESALAWQILNNKPIELPTLSAFYLPKSIQEVDLWFPVLHGPNGEDGTVQGLLQLTQKPYVGNGVLAAAVGMDKLVMKSLFAQSGLAQVNYVSLTQAQWKKQPDSWLEHIVLELGYPCFVKPANLGSSVGISKVRHRSELVDGIESALSHDSRILIEQGVVAREIECAVLGNEHPIASTIGEIHYDSDFYDYDTKYIPGRASLSIPAQLPQEVITLVQDLSIKAFQTIGGSGLARVDFFYVESSATILINEINTMPGFTTTSMYPKLWEASGIPFPMLCDRLVELAQERYGKICL